MSNKTQQADGAKTALALKKTRRAQLKKFRWAIVGVLVLAVLTLVLINLFDNSLRIGSKSFSYEVADTSEEREKGLSDRASLAEDHAMVFVFDDDSEYCFWMKDMKFPLDVIWLDGRKSVIYVQKNLQPNSYPNVYCPDKVARYVVEVKAGIADELGIKDGQTVKF